MKLLLAINDLENYESTSEKDRPRTIKSFSARHSNRFKVKRQIAHRRIDEIDIEEILNTAPPAASKEEVKSTTSRVTKEGSVLQEDSESPIDHNVSKRKIKINRMYSDQDVQNIRSNLAIENTIFESDQSYLKYGDWIEISLGERNFTQLLSINGIISHQCKVSRAFQNDSIKIQFRVLPPVSFDCQNKLL